MLAVLCKNALPQTKVKCRIAKFRRALFGKGSAIDLTWGFEGMIQSYLAEAVPDAGAGASCVWLLSESFEVVPVSC